MISSISQLRRCGLATLLIATLVLPAQTAPAVAPAVPIIVKFLVEWAAGYVLSEFVAKLQGQDGGTLKNRLDELTASRAALNGELRGLRTEQQQLNRAVALLAAEDAAKAAGYEALLASAAYCSQAGSRRLALYESLDRLVLPAHRGDTAAQRELYERLKAEPGINDSELRWATCITGQVRDLRAALAEAQGAIQKLENRVDDHTRLLVKIQLYLEGIENERILEQGGRGRQAPAVILMHEKSLTGFDLARSVTDILTPAAGQVGLRVLQYNGTILADDAIVSLAYWCAPNRQIHECALRLHGPGSDLTVSAFGPDRDVALRNLPLQLSPEAVRRFATNLAGQRSVAR